MNKYNNQHLILFGVPCIKKYDQYPSINLSKVYETFYRFPYVLSLVFYNQEQFHNYENIGRS